MKKFLLSSLLLFFVAYYSFSQSVGIGTATPNTSAALDITSPIKGLLIPRMNMPGILAIITPAKGLLVYDSVANQLMVNTGNAALPNWRSVANGSSNSMWSLTGNSDINPANQFIGTTDNQPLQFRVSNLPAGALHPLTGNIFFGLRSGEANTTGFSNIAIGTDALKLNVTASNLVAIGDSALFHNGQNDFAALFGLFNTAIGSRSLFSNTTGSLNTAVGRNSLSSNTSGFGNSAFGVGALLNNTTGGFNTVTGTGAASANTTGEANTAYGWLSLEANTSGDHNTAFGGLTLSSNTTASGNVAIGYIALTSNTTGENNTAIGRRSLIHNTTGNSNTAVGGNALAETLTSSNNTVMGFDAAFTFDLGSDNTIIGTGADANAAGITNSVAIGKDTRVTGNNQVRFGNTLTTSIGGVVGFTNLSDGRYKKNIQETVKGIDFIMKLRPVTYQLDVTGINNKLNVNNSKEINSQTKRSIAEQEQTVFSGFVAQEVEHAAITIGYNFSGVDKPKNENDMYGLRYSEFVVPLVKAMQEQQQMIAGLKKQNADLLKRVVALEKK